MLQEQVEGVAASAAFVANGRRAVIVGWAEQLRKPGSYLYGGNMMPLRAAGPATLDAVREIVGALTAGFGLRGLNGLDFILEDERPVPVEVNPRYSASMELVERATGVSMFALHLDACEGRLPDPGAWSATLQGTGSRDAVWGKGIVYARRGVQVGDTGAWLARGWRDIPHPGEVIRTGHPVCTVFATAPGHARCRARLRVARSWAWGACLGSVVPGTARSGSRPGSPH
jgi:predicted ATP-grasp superfamily ATP-dependent carboligase